MKKVISILASVLIISCSKSETEPKVELTGKDGGIVSRFQIVMIEVNDKNLLNESYIGTFNNKPITLSKVEDKKLMFYIDESTPIGKTQLTIPTLNNTKIIYEVIDVALKQSAEATLQPLLDSQKQYGASLTTNLDDAPYLKNHISITKYLANLSNADKIEAAKFYKTNKTIFDAVYNTDYNSIQGKLANKTQTDFDFQLYRSLVNRHLAAVAVTIIGGFLAITPPYEPIETSLSIAIALAGIKKSRDFHNQITQDVLRVVQVNLNGALGQNNKLSNVKNTQLMLVENELVTTTFLVDARNIDNTDSSLQKEFVQKFFIAKNKLNVFIGKTNTTITWMNDNIPFINLNTISTTNVADATTPKSLQANSDIMQRFTFTISHPNLLLETATLGNKGELKLKVKFVGNPSAAPITSSLKYTYNDDFSSFSGSFPIVVNSGTSTLQSLSFVDKTTASVCIGGGKDSYSVIYQHQASFTGASPEGGTLLHRTLWDNQNDNFFEGVGAYMSVPIQASNVARQGTSFVVTGNGNGYCWGLLSTQLKVEYYYVSAGGVESPHYFVQVAR